MKIKINRESFQRVFQIAAAVAPSRSTKAILQNVKLVVTQSSCTLLATDTEVGVRLEVPSVSTETPGSAVVPVSRLNMILRESNDEVLDIHADGDKTLVTGANSKFELQSFNPDEFPDVIGFNDKNYFEISGATFKGLIKRTLFATDSESSRYALGGVLLEMEGDNITAVGTDGRRLAKMEGTMTTVGEPETGPTTIVPSRSMQLMDRMVGDNEDQVIQISPRSNDLLMKTENVEFYTRLVEGRFPKWRDVFKPRTDTFRIDIPVGPMYAALRQAAIVTSDDSRGIDFTFNDGSLVLTNSTAEIGQSRVEIPVPFDNKDELTITLDHRYVADFLKVLKPDNSFVMDVENADAAAYCETDDKYGYVIMPLAKNK